MVSVCVRLIVQSNLLHAANKEMIFFQKKKSSAWHDVHVGILHNDN